MFLENLTEKNATIFTITIFSMQHLIVLKIFEFHFVLQEWIAKILPLTDMYNIYKFIRTVTASFEKERSNPNEISIYKLAQVKKAKEIITFH